MVRTFIEDEGFTPIGEDQYECAGGHVWHIDEIKDLWHQTINAQTFREKELKNFLTFGTGRAARNHRAKVQGRVINNAL